MLRSWDNIDLSCRLNRLYNTAGDEMVSLCSLIRLISVCADRNQPEFLCSCSDSRYLKVHVATAGGWLTRYRPHEGRNSIYQYRKIHIDYRSKFLYRFILPISIIYVNTRFVYNTILSIPSPLWDNGVMNVLNKTSKMLLWIVTPILGKSW